MLSRFLSAIHSSRAGTLARITTFSLLTGLSMACAASDGDLVSNLNTRDSDVADPFPKSLLNHTTWKVFRDQNMLGYTFRDEPAQVLYLKFWNGKELRPTGRGDNRTINYSKKQALGLSARIPGLAVKAGYKGDVEYKVVLQGLKVYQLAVPVLENEYRDSQEAKSKKFIVSMLAADKVIIQANLKTDAGVKVGSRADILKLFSGNVNYSSQHKGVVGAENVFIGYRTASPTQADLARVASSKEEIRKLAIFDLEDKTRDNDMEFLSFTMRHKLEEAFSGIPGFEVLTSRKNDAKYHLKGSYRKIGTKRIFINLELKNTYNNRVVGKKLARGIKIKDVDGLYDLQIEIVKEYVGNFGVKLKSRDSKRLEKVVKQTKDLNLLKQYRVAVGQYNRGQFKTAKTTLEAILKKDPVYIDALTMYGRTLQALSQFEAAEKQFNLVVALAESKGDPVQQALAYKWAGRINQNRGRYDKAISLHTKALNLRLKKFGEKHPLVAESRADIAWNLYRKGGKSNLRKAEKLLVKSYDLLRARYGSDSPRIFRVYGSLGAVYQSQRKYKQAIRVQLHVLKLREKLSGMNSPNTAIMAGNVGQLYATMGQYDNALKYLGRSLKLTRKIYKTDNTVRAAWLYHELGYVYWRLNDFELAVKFFEAALRIKKNLYRKGHPSTKITRNILARSYLKNGDKATAAKLWKENGTYEKNLWRLKKAVSVQWKSASGGVIPPGAYVAGKEGTGQSLYICRVRHANGMQIGKVRPAFKGCNFSYNGRELKQAKYQVLSIQKLTWKKAIWGDMPRGAYVAGYESSKPLYVCRVHPNSGQHIGKVRPAIGSCAFGYGGKELKTAEYEVLFTR